MRQTMKHSNGSINYVRVKFARNMSKYHACDSDSDENKKL